MRRPGLLVGGTRAEPVAVHRINVAPRKLTQQPLADEAVGIEHDDRGIGIDLLPRPDHRFSAHCGSHCCIDFRLRGRHAMHRQPSRQHAGKAHLLRADRLPESFHPGVKLLQPRRRFPSFKVFFGRRDGEHQAPGPLLIEYADQRRSPARPLADAEIRVAAEISSDAG